MRSRWHDSTTPPMIAQMLNSCAPSSSSASARHLTMMRSLSSGIPPPRVACHRLGCGRFSRRWVSGSFGSVRGQSRRRSAARFSRSIGGALQGTHLGDVEAERLVGRGDEGRPLAGLNLETPESHLVVSQVVVCEAVCDDGDVVDGTTVGETAKLPNRPAHFLPSVTLPVRGNCQKVNAKRRRRRAVSRWTK